MNKSNGEQIPFTCTAKCGNKDSLGACKKVMRGTEMKLTGEGVCNHYSPGK